jgi:hypothetical protein
MKKYDASLVEVWEWKDKVYQEIKDMPVRDRLLKIRNDAERILSDNHIELKSISQHKARQKTT